MVRSGARLLNARAIFLKQTDGSHCSLSAVTSTCKERRMWSFSCRILVYTSWSHTRTVIAVIKYVLSSWKSLGKAEKKGPPGAAVLLCHLRFLHIEFGDSKTPVCVEPLSKTVSSKCAAQHLNACRLSVRLVNKWTELSGGS